LVRGVAFSPSSSLPLPLTPPSCQRGRQLGGDEGASRIPREATW